MSVVNQGEGADWNAGVRALVLAVCCFLVVCLFGHLGNVPTGFGLGGFWDG